MLFYESIEPNTLELLKKLLQNRLLKSFRLVGGTSLALQLGHRISVDIDLFGQLEGTYQELNEELKGIGKLQIIKNSTHINIYTLNDIKVDIVDFSYPWLEPQKLIDGISLATPKDIVAMKLAAITGRGTKKDFIDLYFLLQHFSFAEMMSFYTQKYDDGSEFMVLKSLTYFADADSDPSPKMLKPMNWEQVKESILEVVDKYE